MRYIFMSDLHLSEDTPDNNSKFYLYLEQWCGRIDALYLLGDFFDYWIGDDYSNDFIVEMKSYLREFTKITPIYFIGGNHDFAVGKLFCKETGVTRIADLSVLDDHEKRIVLSHGDYFCTLDIGYQKMKKILQNRFVIFILRRIPISWRLALKAKLNSSSDKVYDPSRQYLYQVIDRDIIKVLDSKKSKILIHGHTHNPQLTRLVSNEEYLRCELPAWGHGASGGYLEYIDGQYNLVKGDLSENI